MIRFALNSILVGAGILVYGGIFMAQVPFLIRAGLIIYSTACLSLLAVAINEDA